MASMGLLSGDAPLADVNPEDPVEDVDGEGLLMPPLLPLLMLTIVSEIVCLAACLALSVDTKLLTRSFRFPLTSGEASSSRDSPPGPVFPPGFRLSVRDLRWSAEESVEEERSDELDLLLGSVADLLAKGSC